MFSMSKRQIQVYLGFYMNICEPHLATIEDE